MPKFKKFIKKKTEKQLIIEFILRFENYALKKERLKKRFSFVLTGGLSPINLYKSLSKAKINWKNIDLFWGDERFVSQNSNNSNYKLVKRYLLKKINIKKKNIYFINTKKRNVAMSALDYQNQIKKYFKKKKISFDLILLGMGLDGHVASIFPNNLNKSNICSPVIRKDFKRITLNLKIINKSKMIILWLNTKKSSLIYKNFNNQKKIPVNYLNEKKLSIYSL
jgi:6-phosphogluconolactonase